MSQAVLIPDLPSLGARIEGALHAALDRGMSGTPPKLRAAMEHAVFPGGARLRPQLCLAVARACGNAESLAAAVAVELMHCASLVHDDLACFDDAEVRRGRPTVARKFGEAAAVLAGDGLIVLALREVAGDVELVGILAEAAGPARGLVAGQAWELEPEAPLAEYHRAKTSSLFEAAAMMGARAAGREAWRSFGEAVGRAYQAADDIADLRDKADKSHGRDAALGRPSVVRSFGEGGAKRRVLQHLDEAARRVPPCERPEAILDWLEIFRARAADLQR